MLVFKRLIRHSLHLRPTALIKTKHKFPYEICLSLKGLFLARRLLVLLMKRKKKKGWLGNIRNAALRSEGMQVSPGTVTDDLLFSL